ncbi:hypothetical protein MRX96_026619 [Rhipicephalus microplus]
MAHGLSSRTPRQPVRHGRRDKSSGPWQARRAERDTEQRQPCFAPLQNVILRAAGRRRRRRQCSVQASHAFPRRAVVRALGSPHAPLAVRRRHHWCLKAFTIHTRARPCACPDDARARMRQHTQGSCEAADETHAGLSRVRLWHAHGRCW